MQKRAYKVMAAIFEGHPQFARDNLEKVVRLFTSTTERCSLPAKKLRMRCIRVIVDQLDDQNLQFIPAVLGDVIMSINETNAKARDNAEMVLLAIGNKMSTLLPLHQFTVSSQA